MYDGIQVSELHADLKQAKDNIGKVVSEEVNKLLEKHGIAVVAPVEVNVVYHCENRQPTKAIVNEVVLMFKG